MNLLFAKHPSVVLLLLVELLKGKAVSTYPKYSKVMGFMDNYIGLADVSDVDSAHKNQKRTSIVDGGVFVPYKSTTIVYKSRLVPVTYGFVINKETLKDNPALYKLGVKMLDKKVERTKKKHSRPQTNCVNKPKLLLRVLHNLSKDIKTLEQQLRPEIGLHDSGEKSIMGKKLSRMNRRKGRRKKLHPEPEFHESGHKGRMEKTLNKKKRFSKTWLRYLLCTKRNSKKRCSAILKKHKMNAGQEMIPKLRNKPKKFKKGRKSCKRCKVVHGHRNGQRKNHDKQYGYDIIARYNKT